MKLGLGIILSATCASAVLPSYPPAAAENAPHWQTGRLKSADLSGHGPRAGGSRGSSPKRSDVWWVYCVSSEGRYFSLVSRLSPAKAGMTVGGSVRFSVERNVVIIANPKGEHHAFRIIRQGKGNVCR